MTNEEAERIVPKEWIGRVIKIRQDPKLLWWGDKVKVTDVATTIIEYGSKVVPLR